MTTCTDEKIINPKSGRYVLRSGTIGKKLIESNQIFTDIDEFREYVNYRNKSIDDANNTIRRYDLEQKYYKSSPEYKEAQRQRSKNRALFMKQGLVKKGDGSQIHHKNGDPNDNRLSNLVVVKNACEHNKLHGKKCT